MRGPARWVSYVWMRGEEGMLVAGPTRGRVRQAADRNVKSVGYARQWTTHCDRHEGGVCRAAKSGLVQHIWGKVIRDDAKASWQRG